MPRAEAGSVKAIGNAIKAKGLTKLRFYCQICQKACRDQNGYKCHIESESHMRQIAALGNNSSKVIDKFSKEFQDGFVSLLSRRFGTAKINANKVYQEYIQERHHLHMNATRWVSLSEFVKHLGREGICKVEEITDEGQFGWYVTWIDNSPAALARQDALQKMERAKVDEEGRTRKLLNQQIERAKERAETDDFQQPKVEEGLQRKEGSLPLKIGDQSFKITLGESSGGKEQPRLPTTVATTKPTAFKFGNALKPPSASSGFKNSGNVSNNNVLSSRAIVSKPASAEKPSVLSSSSLAASRNTSQRQASTAAERIMAEEQALREKRKHMGPQPSAKRTRM